MATRYTYSTTVATGTDGEPDFVEWDVEVSYTVAWGSSATGRPYYGPVELYDEGSPDEVEDLKLELVNGTKAEPAMAFGSGAANQEFEAAILQDVAMNHTDDLLEEARQREAAWAE